MTLNCGNIWTSVSEVIRQRISADGYERWFQGVDVISDDGLKLVFRVPNPIHQFFIESNYLRLVQEAASEVLRSPRKIQFIAPGAGDGGGSYSPRRSPCESPRLLVPCFRARPESARPG